MKIWVQMDVPDANTCFGCPCFIDFGQDATGIDIGECLAFGDVIDDSTKCPTCMSAWLEAKKGGVK